MLLDRPPSQIHVTQGKDFSYFVLGVVIWKENQLRRGIFTFIGKSLKAYLNGFGFL